MKQAEQLTLSRNDTSLTLGVSHRFSMDSSTARLVRETNGVWKVSSLGLAKRVLHLPFDYHLFYVEAEQSLGVTRLSARLRRERLRWNGHMLYAVRTLYCLKR